MSARELSIKPRTLAFLSLALVCVYLPVANWKYFAHYCRQLTDYHLISLSVENAKNFEAFSGAYSRLGFRHPGPILFYWYALWEALIPFHISDPAKHSLAQFILSIVFLACLIHISARSFSFKALPLLWVPLTLILLRGKGGSSLGPMSDVWNPYATPIPTLLLLVSAAALAAGDGLGILYLSFAAVVMSHAHLGALPIAGIISIVAIAALVKKIIDRDPPKNWKAFSLWAAAFIAVTSLPVLYEAATRPGFGNLGKILAFSKNARAELSLGSAFELFSPHVFKPLRLLFGFKQGSDIFLIAALALIWLPGISDKGFRSLRAFCSLAILAALYSTMRIKGAVFGYLVIYQFGIAALIWSLLVWRIADLCLRFRKSAPKELRAISLIILVSLAASPLWLKGRHLRPPRTCLGMATHDQFASALPDPRTNYFRFALKSESTWPFAGQLAYLMRSKGYNFCFPEKWSFVFDFSQSCAFQDKLARNANLIPLDVVIDMVPDRSYKRTAGFISYHGTRMSWPDTAASVGQP